MPYSLDLRKKIVSAYEFDKTFNYLQQRYLTMNVQLVDAIVQISQVLSPEERQLLIQELNQSLLTEKVAERSIESPTLKSEQGWEAFLTLGQIAVLGKLNNVSIEHDYFYK